MASNPGSILFILSFPDRFNTLSLTTAPSNIFLYELFTTDIYIPSLIQDYCRRWREVGKHTKYGPRLILQWLQGRRLCIEQQQNVGCHLKTSNNVADSLHSSAIQNIIIIRRQFTLLGSMRLHWPRNNPLTHWVISGLGPRDIGLQYCQRALVYQSALRGFMTLLVSALGLLVS